MRVFKLFYSFWFFLRYQWFPLIYLIWSGKHKFFAVYAFYIISAVIVWGGITCFYTLPLTFKMSLLDSCLWYFNKMLLFFKDWL